MTDIGLLFRSASLSQLAKRSQDIMHDHAERCADVQAKHLQFLAMAFMEQTGCRPDEVELVQEIRGFQMVWWFRKRNTEEGPPV